MKTENLKLICAYQFVFPTYMSIQHSEPGEYYTHTHKCQEHTLTHTLSLGNTVLGWSILTEGWVNKALYETNIVPTVKGENQPGKKRRQAQRRLLRGQRICCKNYEAQWEFHPMGTLFSWASQLSGAYQKFQKQPAKLLSVVLTGTEELLLVYLPCVYIAQRRWNLNGLILLIKNSLLNTTS